MVQLRNRKRFVHTLGVAGLGLGLLASTAGTPPALAQEQQAPGIDRQLFQYEEGALDLSEHELKQLLIQLLQEREQEKDGALAFQGDKDGALAFQGDKDGGDVVISRLHVGDREDREVLQVAAYNEFTQALADELGIDDPDEIDSAIRNAMMEVVGANDGLSKEGAEQQKALIAAADVPIGPAYRGHGG